MDNCYHRKGYMCEGRPCKDKSKYSRAHRGTAISNPARCLRQSSASHHQTATETSVPYTFFPTQSFQREEKRAQSKAVLRSKLTHQHPTPQHISSTKLRFPAQHATTASKILQGTPRTSRAILHQTLNSINARTKAPSTCLHHVAILPSPTLLPRLMPMVWIPRTCSRTPRDSSEPEAGLAMRERQVFFNARTVRPSQGETNFC